MGNFFSVNDSNTEHEPINNAIRLTHAATEKLKNFIIDVVDGKDDESLQYVILEGNNVVVTITRYVWQCKYTYDNVLEFEIQWCTIEDGNLEYYGSDKLELIECLRWFKKRVSLTKGAMAIEDPEQKAFDTLTSNFYDWEEDFEINWNMLEGESFVATLPEPVIKLRSDMKIALNRGCSLESLSAQKIRDCCDDLEKLPLPKLMVDNLKE